MSYEPAEVPDDSKVERELRRVADASRFTVLNVLAKAPSRPAEGMVVMCDGVNWNPIGDGIKRPIWFDAVTGLWNKFT